MSTLQPTGGDRPSPNVTLRRVDYHYGVSFPRPVDIGPGVVTGLDVTVKDGARIAVEITAYTSKYKKDGAPGQTQVRGYPDLYEAIGSAYGWERARWLLDQIGDDPEDSLAHHLSAFIEQGQGR